MPAGRGFRPLGWTQKVCAWVVDAQACHGVYDQRGFQEPWASYHARHEADGAWRASVAVACGRTGRAGEERGEPLGGPGAWASGGGRLRMFRGGLHARACVARGRGRSLEYERLSYPHRTETP